jgi:hypothetical protein
VNHVDEGDKVHTPAGKEASFVTACCCLVSSPRLYTYMVYSQAVADDVGSDDVAIGGEAVRIVDRSVYAMRAGLSLCVSLSVSLCLSLSLSL